METDFIFSGSKFTADGDCSHEIKRRLLPRRKVMTSLNRERSGWIWEVLGGLKIAGRIINNLKYADDTTLMAESEEELKSLLMKEESEKVGFKLNIQKIKIMGIQTHHFMANTWGNSGNSGLLYL